MKNDNLHAKLLLGDDAYISVVDKLKAVVRGYEAQTIEGKQFQNDLYTMLNESITPMLDLKPFITKGESFAGNDKTIADILSAIDKKVLNNTDLNFLINMAKEEHFMNMTRSGHPSPQSTVEAIKDEFDKTNGDIQKSIASGIFDCLDSQILGDIKKKLGYSENIGTKSNTRAVADKTKGVVKEAVKPLNENDTQIFDKSMIYSPVGFVISRDCIKNDNSFDPDCTIAFVNKTLLSIHNNEFNDKPVCKVINSDCIDVTDYLTLMAALSSCIYDPTTSSFTTAKQWDYDILLTGEGDVIMNGDTPIAKEDLMDLFIESIEEYKVNPAFNDELVREYQKDADNFLCLVDNWDMLARFSNLKVVETRNENTAINPFVMFNTQTVTNCDPTVIVANDGFNSNIVNTTYNNYSDMISAVNQPHGTEIFNGIFANMIAEENNNNVFRMNRIATLREQQSELNSEIEKINNLITAAAANSPAMEKLNNLKKQYDEALNRNIEELMNLE